MAKFCSVIGYAEYVETSPGVNKEVITEIKVYGEVLKFGRKTDNTEYIHGDIVMDNQFSIVMNPYISDHLFAMRYILWMGVKWKIATVTVRPPRLVLTVGGVYNGTT